jgi:hypothetical protein
MPNLPDFLIRSVHMRAFANERMARVTREIAALDGLTVDLLPSGGGGTDLQLIVACDNGAALSVQPDLDAPALYVLDHYTDGPRRQFNKLSLSDAIAIVSRIAAEPAEAATTCW